MEFLSIIQITIHYGFHFLVPGLLTWIFFRDKWKVAWILMVATMIVDADHLLANPLFDPNRCSIGFHPFHSYYAIGFYFLMLFIRNSYVRIIGLGLLFHMLTDFQDCLWMKFM